MKQRCSGFPQAVKDACKHDVCIQKRTDKGKRTDTGSGCSFMKQKFTCKRAEKIKKPHAGGTRQKTGSTGAAGYIADTPVRSERLQFCDRRREHDGSGICDRGRKQDAGKRHACKNSIQTQSIALGKAIHTQSLWNQHDFDRGEKREKQTVECQRKGCDSNFGEFAKGCIYMEKRIIFCMKMQT